MKKADLILCADIHIMENTPICRTDDFLQAQWDKLDFISDLQSKHDCPVACAGDFFNHWKPSPFLLTETIKHIPNNFCTIYGDHDIPSRNFNLIHKSGLRTLEKAGAVTIVQGGHGIDKHLDTLAIEEPSVVIKGRKILLWHLLVWKEELPFPGCTTGNAAALLKKYPDFDCIVTGDNHKPFTQKYEKRLLVNTGSMLRMRADQIDYRPAAWLYYAKTNTVVKAYFPIKKGVVSREHLEDTQRHNDRIDAFVGAFQSIKRPELDFEKNVHSFVANNKVPLVIRDILNSKFHKK